MPEADDPSLAEAATAVAGGLLSDQPWAERQLATARRRAHSGKPCDRLLKKLFGRLRPGIDLVARRAAQPLQLAYPDDLPVSGAREAILASLRERRTLVLTGETGSGKTTQLPKMLWELGHGRRGQIAVTQPRRVAAMATARRLAEELQAPDKAVAHAVRFDDQGAPETVIRVLTDGLLLAEAGGDPDLRRYDAIIVDEAHERGLNIDVLLGLLRRIRSRRPELTVVVTSASIDAEAFANYFNDAAGAAPIIQVSGRSYPVEIIHRDPGDSDLGYLPALVQAVQELHESGEPGDVLGFLPTERDILEAARRLQKLPAATVLPLFSRLNAHEQQRVFAPTRGRKIVLATNIAETSLTVPGICFVVDAGLARTKRYAASSRTERLPIEPVAQASAIQRAGRAGRLGPGVCLRLYSAEDFAGRPAYAEPELLRSNLAGVLLTALAFGWGDPEDFPWLDPPRGGAWQQARQQLAELGAIDQDGRLTRLGRRMARLPCDPQIARMLLAGVDAGVSHEVCTVAAYLSVQEPRLRPPEQAAEADAAQARFRHEAGDFLSALQLWQAYQDAGGTGAKARFCQRHLLGYRRMREWADLRRQFWQTLRQERELGRLPDRGHDPADWPIAAIHQALLAGLIGSIAGWQPREACYRSIGNRQAVLHPGSALLWNNEGERRKGRPAWVMAAEIVETGRTFLRQVAPVELDGILAVLGDRAVRRHAEPRYDEDRRRVVCEEWIGYKGLTLCERRVVGYRRLDPERATAVFIDEALVDARLATPVPAFRDNRRLADELQDLAARLRDPGFAPEPAAWRAAYRRRLGPAVVDSDRSLQAWLRRQGAAALRIRPAELVDEAVYVQAREDYPDAVQLAGRRLPLRYRHRPGSDDDGATLELGEADLGSLTGVDCDRLVPGLLPLRIEAGLRALPKEQRKALIPLRDSIAALTPELRDSETPFELALRQAVAERLGEAPRFGALADDHPGRLRFILRDADGQVLYTGRDQGVLLGLGGGERDPLDQLRPRWETAPGAEWPGPCPAVAATAGRQVYPAVLRSRGSRAEVAVQRSCFLHARAAEIWHADGVAAWLEARFDAELTMIAAAPAPDGLAAAVEQRLDESLGGLRRRCAVAVLHEQVPAAAREMVADAAAAAELAAVAGRCLQEEVPRIDGLLRQVADAAKELQQALRRGASGFSAAAAAVAVGEDRQRLLQPGWPDRWGWAGAQRLPRFLQACRQRLAQEPGGFALRRERLLGAWQTVEARVPPRLIQILGFAPAARRARWAMEEALAQAVLGGDMPDDLHEGQVREVAWQLQRRAEAVEERFAALHRRLRELRPYLERQASGPLQRALLAACDRQLERLPEFGFACDLDHQAAQVERLLADAKRAMGG